MLEPMTLTDEQQEALDRMLSTESQGACALASDMGTGKTVLSVEACKALNAKVVLVIGPLQTLGKPLKEGDERSEGWHGTFMQQQFPYPFRQIKSDEKGKATLADYQWNVPGVYFIGQEMFTKMGWEIKEDLDPRGNVKKDKKGKAKRKYQRLAVWGLTKPDVVIFDEIHRIQNADSRTFNTLMGAGQSHAGGLQAGFKIGASGTITGNTFDGAWAVTRWLWPDLIDQSIYVWRAKWAEIEYDHFAVRNQKVVGEKEPGAFFNSLPCYIRHEARNDIEIDEKNVEVVLYDEQRRVYNELEQMQVAWIKENPMVTSFPIVKRTRQRQATLGMPSVTEDGDVSFDLECESVKIDSMWSILENDFEGEPAIIFTDSQQFAEVLVHRIGQQFARKWSGKVSQKKRAEIKKAFIDGEFPYLVAVIAASGTGTDGLQFACRNLLYMSSDDSRIDNEQSVARVVRRGQAAKLVRIRRLIALDTIDSGQLSSQIEAAIRMNRILKARRREEERNGRTVSK